MSKTISPVVPPIGLARSTLPLLPAPPRRLASLAADGQGRTEGRVGRRNLRPTTGPRLVSVAASVPVLLLALTLGIGCDPVAAGSENGFRSGEWWGGFGLMDGPELHWGHLTMTLRADGPRLSGEGTYVFGPEKGQLSEPTFAINGRLEDESLRLRLSLYGGRRLDCKASYEGEAISGTCRRGGQELILRLVKVSDHKGSDQASAVPGIYALGGGRRILVDQLGPLFTLLELPSGQFRALFPKGNGAWTAGPRFIVGHPEEYRLVFGDENVTLQRPGEPNVVGERRTGFSQEAFSFESRYDGASLRGTLTMPPGPGPHPGVVWVHGSGRTPRTEAAFFPTYMADLGFALLAFDKRGVGESEGEYPMPDGSTFSVPFLRRRGEDVASAVRALRRHPGIIEERVGLMGISQGGWVMPIAASSAGCAFTITMSGGATRLSQKDDFSRLTDELLSDASLVPIDEALAKVRAEKPKGHDWSVDFANQPCPGLWLYGLKDRVNPSQLCIEVLEAVKADHQKDFEIVSFPDGNHPLMASRVGGVAERGLLTGFVPGKFTAIESWLERQGLLPSPDPPHDSP